METKKLLSTRLLNEEILFISIYPKYIRVILQFYVQVWEIISFLSNHFKHLHISLWYIVFMYAISMNKNV